MTTTALCSLQISTHRTLWQTQRQQCEKGEPDQVSKVTFTPMKYTVSGAVEHEDFAHDPGAYEGLGSLEFRMTVMTLVDLLFGRLSILKSALIGRSCCSILQIEEFQFYKHSSRSHISNMLSISLIAS
jgi:hypothetical protein